MARSEVVSGSCAATCRTDSLPGQFQEPSEGWTPKGSERAKSLAGVWKLT